MKNIRILKLFGAVTACCLILCLPSAHATILTFDGIGSDFFQDYGDNVSSETQGSYGYDLATEGWTPNVEADYSSYPDSRPAIWPATGYGDLNRVIYSVGGSFMGQFGGILEVQLTADPGYLVQLYDFDMAGYFSDRVINSVEVLDSDGGPLFAQENVTISGAGSIHTDFDFATPLTDDQLTIRFDSRNLSLASDDIGMDNIRFGQTAVPIPGAVWLLGSGLIGLIALERKYKK